MSLLSKLFGYKDSKPEVEFKLRAEFKNQKHFINLLENKDNIIKILLKGNEELKSENKLRPFHFWEIALEHKDKAHIYYSLGANIDRCYSEYLQAASWYKDGWDSDTTYASMLDMIALGYLLRVPDVVFDDVVGVVEKSDAGSSYEEWQPDALLWYIINARKPTLTKPTEPILPELYQSLVDLTRLPTEQAEVAMTHYLENWYDLHREDPWYNSHQKSNSHYKGYWSWEAGAVSKIMNLNDATYRDHPHYPGDLVHWSGVNQSAP